MSIKDNFPIVSPSLILDFINSNQLDPRITFGRSDSTSCATYFDSSGILRIVEPNVPRLDHDPVTLKRRGLLIEESRTNLLLYSTEFDNAWWTANGTAVVTPNAGVAPDGTTTAELVTGATGNLTDSLQRSTNIAISNATAYTLTAYIKLGTATNVGIRVRCPGGSASKIGYFVSGQDVGNGWRRVTANITSDTTSALVYFGLADGTFYIWGAQLEAGAFPTSYIPTTTTALTRASDVASVNTLSPWFNVSEGTLFAQFLNGNDTAAQRFVSINDGSENNVIEIISAGIGTGPYGFIATNNSSQTPGPVPSTLVTTNTSYKTAVAYVNNNVASSLNGVQNITDTIVAIPTGLTKMQIGSQTSSSLWSNSWIQKIIYYTQRLSNVELQALTTTP